MLVKWQPKKNWFTYELLNWRFRMLQYLMDPDGLTKDWIQSGLVLPDAYEWQELQNQTQDLINEIYNTCKGDFNACIRDFQGQYHYVNNTQVGKNSTLAKMYEMIFSHTFPGHLMMEVASNWRESFALKADCGGDGMMCVLFAAPDKQEAFAMVYDAFISIDPDDPCHYWTIHDLYFDNYRTGSILNEFMDWAPPMDVCWHWGWGLQGLQNKTTTTVHQCDADVDEDWWKTLPPDELLLWQAP